MEAAEHETKELLEEFHDAEEELVVTYDSEHKLRKWWWTTLNAAKLRF